MKVWKLKGALGENDWKFSGYLWREKIVMTYWSWGSSIQKSEGGNISECKLCFRCLLLHYKPLQNSVVQTAHYLACYFTAQEFCRGSAVRFSLLYLASPGVAGAGGFISTMALHSHVQHLGAPWLPHIMSYSPRPPFVAWACGRLRFITCFTLVGFQEAEDRRY